jgi:hypothetical protein
MPIIIYLVFVIEASIGLARFLHFKSAAEGRATGRGCTACADSACKSVEIKSFKPRKGFYVDL